MSMITKSGLSVRTIRSASSPLRASSKRCPRSRSSVATKCRLTGLSSTIRIVATNLSVFIRCPEEPPRLLPGQRCAKWIIMPPSWVNSGNEYVTEGEPKGGVREAVADPSPTREREAWRRSLRAPAVIPPTYVRQTDDAGLAKRLRLRRPHHRLPLNHLSAAASFRKL